MKIKMNWKIRALITLSLFLKLNTISFGQIQVTKEKQKAIVEKLANEIIDRYLNSQIANIVADSLKKFGNNATKTIESNAFIDAISGVLRVKGNDTHLSFYYDSLKYKVYLQDDSVKRKLEFEREKKINFGFTKVDILEGNIGYIEMIKFSDFSAEVTAYKIASVMNFIQHTDALIIDLRSNGGGDGRTIDIFKTYFFPEVGQIYFDSISKQESYLTLPFVSGARYLNRPVYIVTGKGTFSAAEKFTYFLQKYKKAIIVGEKTKGGGHSGHSVSILDGYLSFIPTGNAKDPLENVGITPDYNAKESEAVIYAKYLYYKTQLDDKLNYEQDKVLWNITSCEYLLKLKPISKYKFNSTYLGEYENGRTIILVDSQPFIKYSRGSFPLVQINENEFIVDGDDTFGKANCRIAFNTDTNKKGIDNRIFVNDKINHKYFLKK
jgi:C-terminal processing protease CtpA/Prc